MQKKKKDEGWCSGSDGMGRGYGGRGSGSGGWLGSREKSEGVERFYYSEIKNQFFQHEYCLN